MHALVGGSPPAEGLPLRQTLGAVLLQKGDPRAARDAFRDSLSKTTNNSWSLYGLKKTLDYFDGLLSEK